MTWEHWFSLHQIPCSYVDALWWNFYSSRTKEVMAKRHFQVHGYNHELGVTKQRGGLCSRPRRCLMAGLASWWGKLAVCSVNSFYQLVSRVGGQTHEWPWIGWDPQHPNLSTVTHVLIDKPALQRGQGRFRSFQGLLLSRVTWVATGIKKRALEDGTGLWARFCDLHVQCHRSFTEFLLFCEMLRLLLGHAVF